MTDHEIRINIRAEADKAIAEVRLLTKQVTGLQRQIKKTGASAKNVGQLTRSFKSLTTHVAKLAVIYGSFQGLVKGLTITAEFEQSIKQLGVYSGVTANELETLREKALALGESTVFTASQVAGGMNQMALAGLSAEEQLAGVKDVLDLSVVGMLDLEEASNIAVVTMKSFGLEATQLGDIVDVLSKGSTISATTTGELGQALSKVGTVAKTYNVELDETVALLGTLADRGRTGAEAGTQLKIVLSRLAGNREANKAIKELGVSMYDANRQLLPITEQLGKVGRALQKLPPDLRAVQLSRIYGEEGKASAIALMEDLDNVRGKTKLLREAMSDNFASKASKDMMDTLKGSYQELMSALEGLVLKVGKELTPLLRQVTKDMTTFLRSIDEATIKEFVATLSTLLGVVANLAGVIITLGGGIVSFSISNKQLLTVLTSLVGVMALTDIASKRNITTLAGLAFGAKRYLVQLRALVIANRAFLLSPVGLALTAIAVGYGLVADNIEKTTKASNESLSASNSMVEKVSYAQKKIMTYYSQSHKALVMSNTARTKQLTLLGDLYVSIDKTLAQGRQENESDKDWLTRKGQVQTSLKTTMMMIEKVSLSVSKSSDKKRKDLELWNDYKVLPVEVKKMLDKLIRTYETLGSTATATIDKLIAKEQALLAGLGELSEDRIDIENKYYNERLDIHDKFEGRFRELTKTYAQEHQSQRQTALDASRLMLQKEAKAFNELYNGNTARASKYFNELLAMTDKLAIGAIGADGKVLHSAQAVKDEKLRLTKLIYDAEQQGLARRKLVELEAHKLKVQMMAIELELVRSQMQTQLAFLDVIKGKVKEVNANAITLTDANTIESLKDIKKQADELRKVMGNIDVKIATEKATLNLHAMRKRVESKPFKLSADVSSMITEVRLVENKFTRIPITVPVGAEVKYLNDGIASAIASNSEKHINLDVTSSTQNATANVDKFVHGVGRTTPMTNEVVADVLPAVQGIQQMAGWVSSLTPTLRVTADTTPAVGEVSNLINWINSQVATIRVRTLQVASTGGLIAPPQHLATGGMFRGSGRVSGYDPTDSDKVSAMLTGGEFVVKREAVDKYGVGMMNSINSMEQTVGFSKGGAVSGSDGESSPTQEINLYLGAKKFPVMADLDVSRALVAEFEKFGGM